MKATRSKVDKKNIRIPFSRPHLDDDDIKEVVRIMRSDWLTSGPKVAEFEKIFAEYIGCRHAVALNSCTAALHLALILSGIKEGDEVITTPFTFTATANVILYQNAKPVFVDIDKDTFNIDPDKIKEKINKKTRAIVILHYGGHPCDLRKIYSLAEKHNLAVIEDAAHAVGAEYRGKKIGGFGKFTAFSFHAVKNMTTGEGGMLTTNNKELAKKARILRLQGMDKDAWARNSNGIPPWYYRILFLGYKYNMTDVQASLGISQLNKLDSFIRKREFITNIYDKYLNNIDEVITPQSESGIRHARHLYPIRLRTENMRISRDDFISRLLEKGVATSVHFIPLHLQPIFRKNFQYKKGDFPVAEEIFENILSLPLYPGMSKDDALDVVECIDEIVSKSRIS